MARAVRRKFPWLALVAILATATWATLPANPALAARGGGHGGGGFHGGGGGGFHGGGGGFHGGGGFRGGAMGGFNGGGGGFHGGGLRAGGFHGGGFHGGGFHTIHAAPHAATRIGRGSGARQFHATHNPAITHNPAAGNPAVSHGVAEGRHAPSAAAMGRNARAVGRTLSSRPIAAAMHRPGGLRSPMARAAIVTAAAGAAWGHHHGGWWWHHPHGGFGWVGPVFWPYAYYDLYDYAWWGDDYDPYFWDYGYGDIYTGLFGPYDYDALSGYADYLPSHRSARQPAASDNSAQAEPTTLADMCGSDSRNIAGFPIDQFRDAIQPNAEQSTALDELASASQTASETILNSCPKDVPLTAPSRLAAMQQRLEAMRTAVAGLQPAMDKFYGLLSDDQKAKVTALAADQQRAQRGRSPRQATADTGSCSTAQPATTIGWPGDLIDRQVKPTDAQRVNLDALKDAATKAEDGLKSSCPPSDARTPPARLAAVQARLDAMLQAIGTVRPALDTFYNSLSDEQKAAFDAIGPEQDGGKTAIAAASDEPARHHHHRHHHHYGLNVPGMVFRMMGL